MPYYQFVEIQRLYCVNNGYNGSLEHDKTDKNFKQIFFINYCKIRFENEHVTQCYIYV